MFSISTYFATNVEHQQHIIGQTKIDPIGPPCCVCQASIIEKYYIPCFGKIFCNVSLVCLLAGQVTEKYNVPCPTKCSRKRSCNFLVCLLAVLDTEKYHVPCSRKRSCNFLVCLLPCKSQIYATNLVLQNVLGRDPATPTWYVYQLCKSLRNTTYLVLGNISHIEIPYTLSEGNLMYLHVSIIEKQHMPCSRKRSCSISLMFPLAISKTDSVYTWLHLVLSNVSRLTGFNIFSILFQQFNYNKNLSK